MKGNTQNRIDKFLKDIGIYAIGNLGSKLITFMLVPLYTHYITNTDEFGYYDICLTVIFLFIPFVTLQLRDGAFRFLLDCNTKRDKAQIVSFVYRTLITSISISAIIALIISFFIKVEYLWYSLLLLCVMSFYEVITQVTRGLGYTKVFVTTGIISSFCIGIFSILFVVLLNMGITGIFLANILARIVALIYIEMRIKIIANYFHFNIKNRALKRDILKYSLPLLPGVICWWLTGSSDRFFIEHYLGLSYNGIYVVALRFTSILQTLVTIFYQAWQETAIRQYESKDRNKFFSDMFNGYIYILSIILLLYSFGLKLNYFWLIDKSYQESVNYIYLMGVSTMLFAIAAFLDMGYQCARDTARTLPAIILASIVNVVMNYFMVQKFGIYGVITTSIVTYGVLLAYRLHDMRRYFKLKLYRLTWIPIFITVISSIAFHICNIWWQDIIYVTIMLSLLIIAIPKKLLNKISQKLHHFT